MLAVCVCAYLAVLVSIVDLSGKRMRFLSRWRGNGLSRSQSEGGGVQQQTA